MQTNLYNISVDKDIDQSCGQSLGIQVFKISCSFLQNPPGYPPQQQGYPPQSSVGAYPPQAYPGQQPYMTNAPIGGAQMMQPAYSAGYQQDPSKCAPPPAYTE